MFTKFARKQKKLINAANMVVSYLADEGLDLQDGLRVNNLNLEITSHSTGRYRTMLDVKDKSNGETVLIAEYYQARYGCRDFPYFRAKNIDVIKYVSGEKWEEVLFELAYAANQQRKFCIAREREKRLQNID